MSDIRAFFGGGGGGAKPKVRKIDFALASLSARARFSVLCPIPAAAPLMGRLWGRSTPGARDSPPFLSHVTLQTPAAPKSDEGGASERRILAKLPARHWRSCSRPRPPFSRAALASPTVPVSTQQRPRATPQRARARRRRHPPERPREFHKESAPRTVGNSGRPLSPSPLSPTPPLRLAPPHSPFPVPSSLTAPAARLPTPPPRPASPPHPPPPRLLRPRPSRPRRPAPPPTRTRTRTSSRASRSTRRPSPPRRRRSPRPPPPPPRPRRPRRPPVPPPPPPPPWRRPPPPRPRRRSGR
jgi:hypothetical protein